MPDDQALSRHLQRPYEPIFEDRLVTIRFVIPGFVMQSTEEQQAADAAMWQTYIGTVERALAPYPSPHDGVFRHQRKETPTMSDEPALSHMGDCYLNARAGEPKFTLIGRDPHAPIVIRHWANLREYEGESAAKVADARHIADTMEEYRAQLVERDRVAEVERLAQVEKYTREDESILRKAVSAFKRQFR